MFLKSFPLTDESEAKLSAIARKVSWNTVENDTIPPFIDTDTLSMTVFLHIRQEGCVYSMCAALQPLLSLSADNRHV